MRDKTERMTAAEYQELQRPQKEAKYKNVLTEVDGHVFDSKAEAKRYEELKSLQAGGEIEGFTFQPSFLLPGNIRYRPDFMVKGKDGSVWVEDVKGVVTQAFRIKQRLWEHYYPWLELRILKERK